jgi:hypothetical protein
MKFQVSADLAPGVYRAGVAFYVPGDVFSLPDAASPKGEDGKSLMEPVSLKLIPMDHEAREFMVKQRSDLLAKDPKHPCRDWKVAPLGGAPAGGPQGEPDDKVKTPRDLAGGKPVKAEK